MAEEAKKQEAKPAPKTYEVKSVVRRVTSRMLRSTSPTRHRFKQYIGGRRLLRKQSLFFTEALLAKHEQEIAKLAAEGKVIVLDPAGKQILPAPVEMPAKVEKKPEPKKAEAPAKETYEEVPVKQEAPAAKDDAPAEEAEEAPKSSKKSSPRKRGK